MGNSSTRTRPARSAGVWDGRRAGRPAAAARNQTSFSGVQHVAPLVWFGYTPQVPIGGSRLLGRLARPISSNSAEISRRHSVLDRVSKVLLTVAVVAGIGGSAATACGPFRRFVLDDLCARRRRRTGPSPMAPLALAACQRIGPGRQVRGKDESGRHLARDGQGGDLAARPEPVRRRRNEQLAGRPEYLQPHARGRGRRTACPASSRSRRASPRRSCRPCRPAERRSRPPAQLGRAGPASAARKTPPPAIGPLLLMLTPYLPG